ncbi:rhodanese-like domain-containing protein [Psychrobacter sp. A3]|uniref:rhodanese-like domain-containing protein n=1 Tax=Psychrobacter sp. A3 TaxID=2992754 RepID=UPI00237B2819|nr:rhodanese-like domain-containing protein [Psychrobacter sp. A3]MDE0490521.1 rhodanese-like domain-containing protein [Psychrobacter sp. A3]
MIDTHEVNKRLNDNDTDIDQKNWVLLDVRDADERAADAIEGSEHIYVGHLNERWQVLDKHRHYTLMCASGARATVATGWLASQCFDNLDIYLGGIEAWRHAKYLAE